MRSSEWLSFRRCLAIIQRLFAGPASPAELLDYVIATVGDDCYPLSSTSKRKSFKHDRESIRKRLGVDFYYDPSSGKYYLLDPGPFFSINLSPSSLRAISLLSQTFSGQLGEHSEIEHLIEELVSLLPLEARRQIEIASPILAIDLLQMVDPNGISQRVWAKTWRAVKEHRRLRFNYISPRYEDSKAALHEVAPYRIQYQHGHWYLHAYRNFRMDANAQINRERAHVKYRLSYIQNDDQLQVMPNLVSDVPKPPKYLVHYRLHPPLSQGAISHHFDDMNVKKLDDGSLELTGYTNDYWDAARILLSYGEFCTVIGGNEIKAWVLRAITGMVRNHSADL